MAAECKTSIARVFPESHIGERVLLICNSALFAGLSEEQCIEIALCSKARASARRGVLFMQGQPVRILMLIQNGNAKLTQISSNGDEVILRISGRGDSVGVYPDQSSEFHSCSAQAIEECRILTWDYAQLQQMLIEYPRIRKNISQILADRLSELEERFREVATEKVAQRLALILLRLVKKMGKGNHRGIQISLSQIGRASCRERV